MLFIISFHCIHFFCMFEIILPFVLGIKFFVFFNLLLKLEIQWKFPGIFPIGLSISLSQTPVIYMNIHQSVILTRLTPSHWLSPFPSQFCPFVCPSTVQSSPCSSCSPIIRLKKYLFYTFTYFIILNLLE